MPDQLNLIFRVLDDTHLKPAAKIILCMLIRQDKPLSKAELASKNKLNLRTIERNLPRLIERELIQIDENGAISYNNVSHAKITKRRKIRHLREITQPKISIKKLAKDTSWLEELRSDPEFFQFAQEMLEPKPDEAVQESPIRPETSKIKRPPERTKSEELIRHNKALKSRLANAPK
jgi:hypothetical protein